MADLSMLTCCRTASTSHNTAHGHAGIRMWQPEKSFTHEGGGKIMDETPVEL
jgi:hypothetical protein